MELSAILVGDWWGTPFVLLRVVAIMIFRMGGSDRPPFYRVCSGALYSSREF